MSEGVSKSIDLIKLNQFLKTRKYLKVIVRPKLDRNLIGIFRITFCKKSHVLCLNVTEINSKLKLIIAIFNCWSSQAVISIIIPKCTMHIAYSDPNVNFYLPKKICEALNLNKISQNCIFLLFEIGKIKNCTCTRFYEISTFRSPKYCLDKDHYIL